MGERAKDFPDPAGGTSLNHLNGHGEAETREFSEIQFEQIRRLTRIGTALSAERNIERLFEMIVEEAREFTGADGGIREASAPPRFPFSLESWPWQTYSRH
jgi:hypothetical protein